MTKKEFQKLQPVEQDALNKKWKRFKRKAFKGKDGVSGVELDNLQQEFLKKQKLKPPTKPHHANHRNN